MIDTLSRRKFVRSSSMAALILTGACSVGSAWAQSEAQKASLTNRPFAGSVDPFLGASGGGNVFPGATVPFGMIKPGPDMVVPVGDPNAGWDAKGPIRGFSQTHVSGTGGGAKYGNVLVQPSTGAPAPFDAQSSRANERASAGYYGVDLARFDIGVEITAARRTAVYRFRYPASTQANLLFDVGHCLLSEYPSNNAPFHRVCDSRSSRRRGCGCRGLCWPRESCRCSWTRDREAPGGRRIRE